MGDIVAVEYRVQHKNGEILHIMGNIKLLEEDGKTCLSAFSSSCTAQKLQEKKKEKRQQELVQALSIDYNLVCFFDLDTGMGFQVRNDENIFADTFDEKHSLEENATQYIEDFVHEDDRDMLRGNFFQRTAHKGAGRKEKMYSVNYRILKEGKIKYFQLKRWYVREHGIKPRYCSRVSQCGRESAMRWSRKICWITLLQANQASKAKECISFPYVSRETSVLR